jgi:hypothetical protein
VSLHSCLQLKGGGPKSMVPSDIFSILERNRH